MKAARWTALLSFPVILLICFSAILGCGGAGTVPDGDLLAMFGTARQNLSDAESYKLTAEMNMDIHFSEALLRLGIFDSDITMAFEYEMLYEKQGDDSVARFVAEFFDDPLQGGETETSSGDEEWSGTVEAYAVNEEAFYQEEPGGEWVYEEFAEGEDFFSSLDQSELSPRFIMDALDEYEGIEIVEETGAYVVYELTIAGVKSLGFGGSYYQDTSMRVKVDKESRLPVEIVLARESSLAEVNEGYEATEFEDPEIMAATEESTFSFLYKIEFSEYGKDFDIRIPQEALDAKP